MNQTMTLAILVLLLARSAMLASETIDDSVRQIDAADLMQISSGPGTHYVYERGHQGTPFTGIVTRTYPDGRKTMTEFKNGRGNGLSILWHANGKKAIQVTLVDDKLHGDLIKWDENGTEISRTTYVNGTEVIPKNEDAQP